MNRKSARRLPPQMQNGLASATDQAANIIPRTDNRTEIIVLSISHGLKPESMDVLTCCDKWKSDE